MGPLTAMSGVFQTLRVGGKAGMTNRRLLGKML